MAAVAAYRALTPAAPWGTPRSVHGPFGEGEYRERLAWVIAVKTAERHMRQWFRRGRGPSIPRGDPGEDEEPWAVAAAYGVDVVAFVLAWNDALKDSPARDLALCRGAAVAAGRWDSDLRGE